ncbi:hypothetical protein CDD83_6359 [Cordyceps sp. RAO-2017]|nr:hypothetical protein CDD83_6359 [Cordyceps sp. RAO-2017]
MTVSIFSKGNDRDKLLVGLFPQAISIESVNYPDGRKRTLRLELWDEIDEAGDVNLFFKRLYRNATAEQQRAMTKSFTESNGTSLSTDWGDVKDRTVETVPPDGVVAKPWEK